MEGPSSPIKHHGSFSPTKHPNGVTKKSPRHSTYVLALLWITQFLSLFGTEVSKFGLRIWTYQSTQSTTSFAMITFFTEVPSILLSPITGPLVDRWDRKVILVGSDIIAGLATLFLFTLWGTTGMSLHHVYFANIVQSIMNAFQWPAFMASITLMVPTEKLVKVNGWNQAASGLSMLLAPTVSAALLSYKDLSVVFLLDFATLMLAVSITTFFISIPRFSTLTPTKINTSPTFQMLMTDALEGWHFITNDRGLVALLAFNSLMQVTNGIVQILFTPLILTFAGPQAIANTLTASGIGALVGFALPGLLKLKDTPDVMVVLACSILQGFFLMMLGSFPFMWSLLLLAFLYMSVIPLNRSCREAIWQKKTPLDMQGRVFTVQQSLSKFSLPLAAILAGPLNDFVFEPFMQRLGQGSWIRWWMGGGEGKGAALMFILLGLSNIVMSIMGMFYQPLRDVGKEHVQAE